MSNKLHPITLIGLNDRAKKIIAYYDNQLLLKEFDDFGKPLNLLNGKPAIFCISPDQFWHGWFILDEDVRFQQEWENVKKAFGT